MTSVDISYDNKKILTGSEDETVKVWVLNDVSGQYELAQTLDDIKAGVVNAVFSYDAGLVVVGGVNGRVVVYQYDTDGYKKPQTIGNFERVVALAVDRSG